MLPWECTRRVDNMRCYRVEWNSDASRGFRGTLPPMFCIRRTDHLTAEVRVVVH